MKKQYIVQKYVLADSVKEAMDKSKRLPVHEVFVHNTWFDKNFNNNFFITQKEAIGLKYED